MLSINCDFKFGLNPSPVDNRNLRLDYFLSTLKTPLPTIPDEYDIDKNLKYEFVEDLFGNDKWGDCVIAGRANHTLRFEYISQGKQIPITAKDCLNEYWYEGNAGKAWWYYLFYPRPDKGLNLLTSLKTWRTRKWFAGGKKYDIYAFLEIPLGSDWFGWASTNPDLWNLILHREFLLRQAIYFVNGVTAGVSITQTTMNQFNTGQTWDITTPIDRKSIGGHCIYLVGYNQTGPIAVTWGKKVQLTWAWWRIYALEAWGVVDNKDDFLPSDPTNVELLQSYLETVTSS